jgi:ABC-2 type transport system permease protein
VTTLERSIAIAESPVASLPVRMQFQTAVALVQRDLAVCFQRSVEFAVRATMQPALFAFVLAYVFPRIGQGIGGNGRGGGQFATILLPGLMASTLIFQGIFNVALPLVQEFISREIEDRAMSPTPVSVVAICKIISGAVQGTLSGLLVIPIVWIATGRAVSVDWGHPILLITMIPIGALCGAALGLLLGTVVEPRQINLLFSLLVLPLTFLGCVYYPWTALSALRWLQIGVLVNPVVYLSEGLRAALVPNVNHMSLWAVYGLLMGALIGMTYFGIRCFKKRVIS